MTDPTERAKKIREAYAADVEVPAPADRDPFLLGTISRMIEEGIRMYGLEFFE